jgi:hypothetical protein
MESQYAFKEAGIDALGALANGALSVGFMLSGALLGAVPNAVLAGVSVWRGIQALGEGIRNSPRQDIRYSGGELTRPCLGNIRLTSPQGRTAPRKERAMYASQRV